MTRRQPEELERKLAQARRLAIRLTGERLAHLIEELEVCLHHPPRVA